jgi:hypothetical protein
MMDTALQDRSFRMAVMSRRTSSGRQWGREWKSLAYWTPAS